MNTRFVKMPSGGTARYCACALSRCSASVVHGGDVMIPPSRRRPTRCVPVKWRSTQLHTFSQARGRHSSISLMSILLVLSYCGLITMSDTPTTVWEPLAYITTYSACEQYTLFAVNFRYDIKNMTISQPYLSYFLLGNSRTDHQARE